MAEYKVLAAWSHVSRLLLSDNETGSDNDEAEATLDTLDTLERKRQYRELRHVFLDS